ncbi:helix-turn-helix transcriptional regulator [Nonomuraea sp. SMC257]|uniref:Helix-turn-helix transcriptional regulator n=1 Tax=Nonomuraea montanisoli TaxID=2741721 RepID=A0A7Y6I5F0_9ACTN|nr:TetR family transcriptional regulator [Nonomuraea montanisoli]NUW31889.1 helix-turn-helix transcriptional regulator [Nonomuraea montanisoli]
MRAAERLYATRGLAGVSIRQIGEAAGQRNNSAVQYHFAGRDALIQAVLAEHAAAIERHRLAMMTALGDPARMSPLDRLRCAVLPRVEHQIELGTPSWYARFLAQIAVEPALREHAVRVHLETPSLRRLYDAMHAERSAAHAERSAAHAERLAMHGEGPAVHAERHTTHGERLATHGERPAVHAERLGAHVERASADAERAAAHAGPGCGGREPGDDTGATARREAMTRQLVVHMCAELETDLAAGRAAGRVGPGDAAAAWRRLGDDLVTGLLGLVAALDADDPARGPA